MEPSKNREDLLKSIIKICPKCSSKNISVVEYQDIMCMVCKKCGYDERDLYDLVPEERASQKAKGEHSLYKAGGAQRIQKTGQKH